MVDYNGQNWKQILAINKIIGECIGKKAEIEYCVGDKAGTSYSYSPKNVGNYFRYPEQQKEECERWVKEQAEKYQNTDYAVVKLENWPRYDAHIDELMKAYDWIEKNYQARVAYKNTQPEISYEVHIVSSSGGFREAKREDKDRHTALYFTLFDFILASVRLVKEAEDGDGYHKCPYCDAKHGQINNHFAHIEFSHPGKPLI